MLQSLGVHNLQNFWYLLLPSWQHQITSQYHERDKSFYQAHISFGNNGNLETIIIQTDTQQSIFFNTISLVLGFPITINTITSTNSTSVIFNPAQHSVPSKHFNIRKSISGIQLFEPWVSHDILLHSKV